MPEKIVVATPAVGDPTWGYVDSLLRLQSPTGMYHTIRTYDLAVDVARNHLAKQALAEDAEWILWVDADAFLHPHTLIRLMSWGVPIVGALCFSASKPTTPTVYKGWASEDECIIALDYVRDWLLTFPGLYNTNGPAVLEPRPAGSLHKVDATGTHCLLVNRVVYETMPFPWFKCNNRAGRGRGEDLYFCREVAKHGFQVHVDMSVTAGHMQGKNSVGPLEFLAWDRITDWSTKSPSIGGNHGSS